MRVKGKNEPSLVANFGRGSPFFDDGICSRHQLEAGNANFWAKSPNLATVFRRKILYFDDEIRSRHHIEVSNLLF